MDETWLQNLKVGDKTILSAREGLSIVTISRLTNTQLIIEYKNANGDIKEIKFNRQSGRHIGGSDYFCSYLEEITSEKNEEVQKRLWKNRVNNVRQRIDLNKLSVDQLTKLYDVYKYCEV